MSDIHDLFDDGDETGFDELFTEHGDEETPESSLKALFTDEEEAESPGLDSLFDEEDEDQPPAPAPKPATPKKPVNVPPASKKKRIIKPPVAREPAPTKKAPPAPKKPTPLKPANAVSFISKTPATAPAPAVPPAPVKASAPKPVMHSPVLPTKVVDDVVWKVTDGPPGISVMSQGQRLRCTREVQRVLGLLSKHELGFSASIRSFVLTRDPNVDQTQRQELENLVTPHLAHVLPGVGPQDIKPILDLVYDDLIDLGPLGPLWRDPEITEILIDAWDNISIERNGILIATDIKFGSFNELEELAKRLAQKHSGRAVDLQHPVVTAELPAARINFSYGPIVGTKLAVVIRKQRPLLSSQALLGFGSFSPDMYEFLQAAVLARATTLISGGTGTGKTTIINALSEFIPDHERVITIEDSRELILANKFWVSLQTKEAASSDDTVIVTLHQLLVNTLRMRPDRIIVGEVREGKGADAMLRAASSGHEGTMTTIHTNSAVEALDTFCDIVREGTPTLTDIPIKRKAVKTFDIVIQLTRESGKRFVSSVVVVDPSALHEDGTIHPTEIFHGELVKGEIVHKQVGYLNPDSNLVARMYNAGVNPSKWLK